MTVATRTFAKFRKAHSRIRNKAANMQPLTKAEKREVLTNARDLLSTNYGNGDWRAFVDNVEVFCMYGALEVVCGFNPEGSEFDQNMSACSLTSTLYDAIPDTDHRKVNTDAQIKRIMADDSYSEAALAATIAAEKVSALQHLNDQKGKDAVLAVFDKALANLSE